MIIQVGETKKELVTKYDSQIRCIRITESGMEVVYHPDVPDSDHHKVMPDVLKLYRSLLKYVKNGKLEMPADPNQLKLL